MGVTLGQAPFAVFSEHALACRYCKERAVFTSTSTALEIFERRISYALLKDLKASYSIQNSGFLSAALKVQQLGKK